MFALLLSSALCALAPLASQSQGERLTLDDVFELTQELRTSPDAIQGWMPDGRHYLSVERPPRPPADGGAEGEADRPERPRPRLVVVDAETGRARPLFDPVAMAAAFERLPEISAEMAAGWSGRTRYDFSEEKDALLLNEANDLFYWRLGAESAVRLTSGPQEEVGEALSPDGRMVAFIRDFNLHVVPADGGPARALTSEGDEDRLLGRLDWVYQEEVYGRGNFKGFWWSPDSRRIAFLELDESKVPSYTIPDVRERYPDVEVWRYPKAGFPNPGVKLAVVDVAGGPVRYFDLGETAVGEHLIVRVGWTPDGSRVAFQVQDRVQTWLDLMLGDPRTGKVRRLLRDRTGVWVEPTDAPFWIDGGERFLWLSERDGWRHLYLYETEDGKLVRRLTEGPWEVDEVHGVDEEGGWVHFSGDREDVKGEQLYRVSLEGGEPELMTADTGTHSISMSPSFEYFVDRFSSAENWGRVEVRRGSGELMRVVEEVGPEAAAKFGLRPPKFLKVPTRDGFEMECLMIEPEGFDPSVRYPVLCFNYSGPHAPQVRDRPGGLNMLFHQMLAQEGYLIWVCDNRSASGRGLESAKGIYKNLGEEELRDLEDSLDWLVEEGHADPERIGIWGWSYGGYMSAYALTHSERFKIGIAGAPVTDWHLYDTIYTERYMGLPQENAEGYRKSSVIEAAGDLSGRLLLIHGDIDENVHLQNTLQLARALQEAGKDFELMIYPGNRHHVGNPRQRKHLYALMADFVRENL